MKEENILDDFTEPNLPPSRKGVDKVIWIYAAVTAFIFITYDLILDDVFPENIWESPSREIPYKGLYFLLSIITIVNLIVRKVNLIAPDFDEIIYVIWGASSIFYGCAFYKVCIELIENSSISISTIWFILKFSMAMSLIGGIISFVVIHRIREKSMFVPYVILIGLAIAINFLLKIIL